MRGIQVRMRKMLAMRFWPDNGAIGSIPALDGLRSVAAVLVVLFHSWWGTAWMGATAATAVDQPINYTRTGVHLFFVLSAFLLSLPYMRWAVGDGHCPSWRLFYKRRLLRVGPAYWLCLAILSLGSLGVLMTKEGSLDVALHAVFLSNAQAASAYSINGVFWTMAVEVQFYAILPLLGMVLTTGTRHFGLAAATTILYSGLIAISLGVGLLEHHGHVSSTFLVGETALPHWLDVFGDGIVAAAIYTLVKRSMVDVSALVGCALFGSGIALALTLAFVTRLHTLPITGILFGWAYTLLLLGVIWSPSSVGRLFASRPLRFIGLISYSLYLWHSVFASFIALHVRFQGAFEDTIVTFALTLSMSVPFSYLSYLIAERPFLTSRRRAREPTGVKK